MPSPEYIQQILYGTEPKKTRRPVKLRKRDPERFGIPGISDNHGLEILFNRLGILPETPDIDTTRILHHTFFGKFKPTITRWLRENECMEASKTAHALRRFGNHLPLIDQIN